MSIDRNSHYLWRIIFTYMIVLGHSGIISNEHASAYIGVDYFFIVSGFFLSESVRCRDESTTAYTHRRIQKLWPHVLFSFFLYFAYLMSISGESIEGIFTKMLLHLIRIYVFLELMTLLVVIL